MILDALELFLLKALMQKCSSSYYSDSNLLQLIKKKIIIMIFYSLIFFLYYRHIPDVIPFILVVKRLNDITFLF